MVARALNRLINFSAGALLVFVLAFGGSCLLPRGSNPITEGLQGLVAQLLLATCRFDFSRYDGSCIFRPF